MSHYSDEFKPDSKKTDPVRFRIGNIVEAQITVMGVPIKKGRTKMVLHLRSLTLLTGSFTEVRS